MMNNGRTFLITGAASGIGLATARLLARRDVPLHLWDVNEAALTAVGVELGAQTAVVDVTDATQVQNGLAACRELGGVIHAAGIIYTGLVADIPLAQQQRLIHVNLGGTLNVAHAALPYLKAGRGSLVLMASTSAFYGPPEFGTYAATKAGVLALAQALRLELERDGVHVGVVCPFFVQTPMIEAGQKTKLYGRFGVAHTAEDVAAAIVRGLEKRRFMIWPSYNPAFFHWLSHIAYPLSHQFMRFFWR